MKKIMFSLLLMLATAAQAEPVVVVSASSSLGALTQDEVRQIFNGQTRRVSGVSVKPLDLPSRGSARDEKLLGADDFYRPGDAAPGSVQRPGDGHVGGQ